MKNSNKPLGTKKERERVAIVISIVAAATALASAAFSLLQWRTADQTLKISNRAYLTTSPFQADLKNARVRIPIENYGRIPAPRLSATVFERRVVGERTIHSKTYNFGGDRTEIPPGPGHFGVTIPLEGLTSSEVESIHAKQEIIYLAGSLKYDDGFGEDTKKDFCFSFDPDPQIGWNACPVLTFKEFQKMTPHN